MDHFAFEFEFLFKASVRLKELEKTELIILNPFRLQATPIGRTFL